MGKNNIVVTPEMAEGMRRAKEAAGGDAKLARMLGIHRTAVLRWHAVPAEHCLKIEREVGVPRRVTRPDIFDTGE